MLVPMMNYSECENYISAVAKFTSNLNKTKELVDMLIDKGQLPKVIHVAGTNGKGSVCSYIESILLASGITVGKFVSPHLVTMRERICLNGEMIGEDDFVKAFNLVKAYAEQIDYKPNYFEYTLLIAIKYYLERQPEFIILETGLGGKLDQTNYVTDDKLVVLTEIGLDHMAYLGDSYEKIASEKAGIIKKDNKVIYYDKRRESSQVIEARINELSARAYKVTKSQIKDISYYEDGIEFALDILPDCRLKISSQADYQLENAAIAVESVLALEDSRIDKNSIVKALFDMKWPGRMEKVGHNFYLDGAHNPDGIQSFITSVKRMKAGNKAYLLFSVVKDKDYDEMIEMIAKSELFDKIIVTGIDCQRGSSIESLRESFSRFEKQKLDYISDLKKAVLELKNCQTNKDDYIFISGSLYLIGQLKEAYL